MKLALTFLVLISTTFAQLPVIKIISPIEEDPMITYGDLNLFGELSHSDRLWVNDFEVDVENGLFRVTYKFAEKGFKKIKLHASNRHGVTDKILKVIMLSTYPDILGHPYRKEIETMSTLDYMRSYMGSDFFRPDRILTRAEICPILVRLKGIDPVQNVLTEYRFRDLLPSHWAYHYIQLALNHNLILPEDANSFNPDRYITREDLMDILIPFLPDMSLPSNLTFKDLDPQNVNHFWLSLLAAKGYLPLSWINEDFIYPNRGVSRGELAYILSRIDRIHSRIKKDLGIDLPKYAKKNSTLSDSFALKLFFYPLQENVFKIKCIPNIDKRILFIELNFTDGTHTFPILVVDDGLGLDVLPNDGVFTGGLNLNQAILPNLKCRYKIFDEFNLIYQAGEIQLQFENNNLSVK